MRRTVRNLYRDTDVYHHIMWTLNPRYYPRLFKTKMFYEQYPEGPNEVDEMVARLHLDIRVIYDPTPPHPVSCVFKQRASGCAL